MKCKCEDSYGHVCNKEMTKEEEEQDGMCWWCTDHVWSELEAMREGEKGTMWSNKPEDRRY